MRTRLARWWPALALVVLLLYPWILRQPYYHVLGFNALLYAMMSTSWNIMGGYTGYKSLGHATFFGLGAYLAALAAVHLGWNPLLSAPVLALMVMLVAFGLGWVMLRTSGSAFVIATIAMLLIFRLLALNLRDITNGAPGLSQPLPPWTPEFSRMPFFYYMLACLIVALLVSAYIRRSRFGLGLLAIRDDEGKAEMVGVNTTLYKVLAFGASAYFVALGGGVWSYFTSHISPTFAFDILIGVDMILMTMLGGLGTLWGPVLGAFILIPASDLILFRFGSSQIHLAIFGALMLAIILFLPRGILPTLQEWLERRRTPRAAFAGAHSMAEMMDDPTAAPGGHDSDEAELSVVEKAKS
ncbi:MAG TPA: branched-chain amino acid ABC transporter permease [Anaerolineae bacterium]|nr:branched-chain amino acid ABC transporter permease [Anaerolineae bacterium]